MQRETVDAWFVVLFCHLRWELRKTTKKLSRYVVCGTSRVRATKSATHWKRCSLLSRSVVCDLQIFCPVTLKCIWMTLFRTVTYTAIKFITNNHIRLCCIWRWLSVENMRLLICSGSPSLDDGVWSTPRSGRLTFYSLLVTWCTNRFNFQ